jgi:hypothetical protein
MVIKMNESFLKTETRLKILIIFLAYYRIYKNNEPEYGWILDVIKGIKKEIEILKKNELNKEK